MKANTWITLLFALTVMVSCKKENKTTQPNPTTAQTFQVKSTLEEYVDTMLTSSQTTRTYDSNGLLTSFTYSSSQNFTGNLNWYNDKVVFTTNVGIGDVWQRNTSSGYVSSSDSGRTLVEYNAENLPVLLRKNQTTYWDSTFYTWSNKDLISKTEVQGNGSSKTTIYTTYEYTSELNTIDVGLKYAPTIIEDLAGFPTRHLPSQKKIKTETPNTTSTTTIAYTITKDSQGKVTKIKQVSNPTTGSEDKTISYSY